MRAIARAVERVSAGDLSVRVEVAGDDELAALVESHNRLAADLGRRNAELGRILLAIGETSPRDDLERLVVPRRRERTIRLLDDRCGDPPRRSDGRAGRRSRARRNTPDSRGSRPAGRARRRSGRSSSCDALVGPSGSGSPGALRERGRRCDTERPAVRSGPGPDRPARGARCRQGRLPARHQPQPPDAADQHPRVLGAAPGRATRSPPRDHHRAIGAFVTNGPAVADGLASRSRHAQAPGRGRGARAARTTCVGGARGGGGAVRSRRSGRGLARACRPGPARSGPLGDPRQRRQVRRRCARAIAGPTGRRVQACCC